MSLSKKIDLDFYADITIADIDTVIQSSETKHDCSPHRATDGWISKQAAWTYETEAIKQPWFQVEFAKPLEVIRVVVFKRMDQLDETHIFKDIGVFVGDEPAVGGKLSSNPRCTNVSESSSIFVFGCDDGPLTGKYLIIQKMTSRLEQLAFGEVIVHVLREQDILPSDQGKHNNLLRSRFESQVAIMFVIKQNI